MLILSPRLNAIPLKTTQIQHNKTQTPETYLTLGPDTNVARNGRIWFVERLLDAQIRQSVLSKDGLGVHIGRHEAALAGQRLFRSQTLHIRALQQVFQILRQIRQSRVHRNL